ncbi:hypothetical protein ART_0042 [Arthrobacter sp. PAMC 25486]|uniref:MarR family winged helix-turn-helix transcriptional regulator n=1 Tax=Arthrobacter sp. PAMC 25486 TaxID=1494608 RepID=UPI00053636AE|nr:hypothetical protein [Arthrobacter sp. PAMC 25486]AIX99640.1 hypothetical protein ART_0042 [Arthrobacter sp. PAMC 25486]
MTMTPPESYGKSYSGTSATVGLELVMLLTAAQSAAAAAANNRLAQIGISVDDLQLLTAAGITGVDRVTLAKRMHATQSQTIRLVRPLEKLGWLQRTDDGLFQLTSSGTLLVDEAARLADDSVENWLLDRLPREQVEQLRTLLSPVAELS